jgi:hypothetical protein
MGRSTGQDLSDGLVARARTVDEDALVDSTAIAAGARAASRLPRSPAQTRRER